MDVLDLSWHPNSPCRGRLWLNSAETACHKGNNKFIFTSTYKQQHLCPLVCISCFLLFTGHLFKCSPMLIMEKLFFSLPSSPKFPLLCLLVHVSSLSVCPALECEPARLSVSPAELLRCALCLAWSAPTPSCPLLRSPVQLCPAPQGAAGLLPPCFPWGSLGTLAQVSFRSGRAGPGLHHWEQSLSMPDCPSSTSALFVPNNLLVLLLPGNVFLELLCHNFYRHWGVALAHSFLDALVFSVREKTLQPFFCWGSVRLNQEHFGSVNAVG